MVMLLIQFIRLHRQQLLISSLMLMVKKYLRVKKIKLLAVVVVIQCP